jgi:hypothetical protein
MSDHKMSGERMSGYEVIDALVDGERVNAAELKRALAEEAGRDYLVDLWLLREEVQEEIAVDQSAPVAAPRRGYSWQLAAAVALVCLVSGYFVGARLADGPASAPPAPVVETRPDAAERPPVPTPTRVIRLAFPGEADRRGGD